MPQTKRLLPLLVGMLLAVMALGAPSALASTQQVSIVQDNNAINKNPVAALTKLHDMGVSLVKYAVYWRYYTPNGDSATAPAGANVPATYVKQLAPLVLIDQAAARVGIKLGFMVTAPAPRWAESTGGGCSANNVDQGTCRPSTTAFTTFMRAMGATFNGSIPGVPAVRWWSIWNEPNYIPNLAPQLSGSNTFTGPDLYRGLLNAGWSGLTGTGHRPGPDTILFGELAPHGIVGAPFNGAGSKPVAFLSALYCETTSGHRLTGSLAARNGCPASARAFRAANPALFSASGIADHPYSQGAPPNVPNRDCHNSFCDGNARNADPLWTDLAQIGNLQNGLSRALRPYGAANRFSIWNTEYGYFAYPGPGTPACHSVRQTECYLNQATAAKYDNWAEYLSYRNGRIVSFDQYQLYEPSLGTYPDGLISPSGTPQLTYYAFEVPLFLPTTTLSHPGNVTVWGGARPVARYGRAADKVEIQFGGHRGFKTVKTVTVSGVSGYFTTSIRVPSSGSVRLVYPTPAGTLISRTETVRVR